MRHIITLIILLAPHIAYGQEQMFRIYNPDTIYYDPSNPPQVFKGGVEYLQTLKLT